MKTKKKIELAQGHVGQELVGQELVGPRHV